MKILILYSIFTVIPLAVALTSHDLFPFIKYSMFLHPYPKNTIQKVQFNIIYKDGSHKQVDARKYYYPYNERSLNQVFSNHLNDKNKLKAYILHGMKGYKSKEDISNAYSLRIVKLEINEELYKEALLDLNDTIDPRTARKAILIHEELF